MVVGFEVYLERIVGDWGGVRMFMGELKIPKMLGV